jgi:predicted regulator of Ras-like GTPase activity (Roadblock/LC7/MglB family)
MNLKKHVNNFFIENEFGKISKHLTLVRNDGIVIYSNSEDDFKSSSIGALSSGLWQAATSLIDYVNASGDQDFRLTFDTSASGIYILPIELNNSRCYLVAVYQGALNPAKLKQQLKNLAFLLEMYIRDETYSVSREAKRDTKTQERDGYLFHDISDEEIDKLFGFTRV